MNIFLSFQLLFNLKLLWYQTSCIKSVFPIPDNLLSGQKGTFILFENFFEFNLDFLKPLIFLEYSQFQTPFKFNQSFLTNCGLGCSFSYFLSFFME